MRRFVNGFTAGDLVDGAKDLMDEHMKVGEEDDARAHRGFLRGDALVIGYTYTDTWGRGNPSRYDLYVRRSFDGGRHFTDMKGQAEAPRNLSNIKVMGNRGWSVMEPRLVGTPGRISKTGKPPIHEQDEEK